jgi:flavodoxin
MKLDQDVLIMQNEDLQNLLKRQMEIQDAIKDLNEESLEITELLLNNQIVLESSKSRQKEDIQKKLEAQGFNVTTATENRIRLWKLSKNDNHVNLIYKESSYHEGPYNAWYTLQPDIEDKVDFVIFNYTDSDQHINSLVISNETLKQILVKIKKTPDGRANININANLVQAKEINSNINLTSYINNFDQLN